MPGPLVVVILVGLLINGSGCATHRSRVQQAHEAFYAGDLERSASLLDQVASGSSSGLKFFLDPVVDLGGGTLDIVLDFVADESVHGTGPPEAPTGYVMTPVIRAVSAELGGTDLTIEEETPAAPDA